MHLNISYDIDIHQVFRYLGYQNCDEYPARLRDEVEKAIKEARRIIQAQAFLEEVYFVPDSEKKRLILPDGQFLSPGKLFFELKDCVFLVVAVTTLGKTFAEKTGEYYRTESSCLPQLVFDAVGTAALNDVNRRLHRELAEKYKEKGLVLTCRLCPGENDIPLQAQQVIFKLLADSIQNVTINEHLMMQPLKSLSLLYGVAKRDNYKGPVLAEEHDCGSCCLEECLYRRTGAGHRVVIKAAETKTVQVRHGENLLEVLLKNGIHVPNSCGGMQSCGKCAVRIDSEFPLPISESEERLLGKQRMAKGLRLACFVEIMQDVQVYVTGETEAQILVGGITTKEQADPRVKRENLQLSTIIPGNGYSIPPKIHSRDLPSQVLSKLKELKNGVESVSAVMTEEGVIDIQKDADKGIYGIAVDIGTTTLAAYLMDLEQGKEIDICSSLNPQKAYGADVITRINYTVLQPQGLQELSDLIIAELNRITAVFCERNGICREDIYETTVAGNTTMLHILLGVPCRSMAVAPYTPVFTEGLEIKAIEIGWQINPEGKVVILPGISAYAGADTLAALVSCDMHRAGDINLLIDIGTNGEIVLGNKDRMVCCSTAAGPAFEGGRITCGMGAVGGAIDHVNFRWDPIYSTIGKREPAGICGSGLLEIVAQLLEYGMIDSTGRMKKKPELKGTVSQELQARVTEYEGMTAFVLDESTGIYITQGDIRELQLAKGAIYTGINLLLAKMGITPHMIRHVFLAGGFGNYLNLDSALTIKLIPNTLKEKIASIGNAAGGGAKRILLSETAYRAVAKAKDKIEYIELSTEQEFQEEYIRNLDF